MKNYSRSRNYIISQAERSQWNIRVIFHQTKSPIYKKMYIVPFFLPKTTKILNIL